MSKDARKALMIAKGQVSSGYLPSRHIAKAEGGEVKSRHPALSIPGFHVREEIHGIPIFTGGRNAN